MTPEMAERWAEQLTKEQREQLQWLVTHRCSIEAKFAPEDPLQGLPPELVLEVLVDRHGVVKIRGEDVTGMFDYIFKAAQNLFDYVEKYDAGWTGAVLEQDEKKSK